MIKFLIFTDGGQFRTQEKPPKFDSVTSVRVLHVIDNSKPELAYEEKNVNVNATGNFSEINAIRKGLEWVVQKIKESELYKGEYQVKVFTDSMLYYNSLTKWIYGWIRRAKNGILYNSNNEPVINQEEILKSFAYIEWLKKEKKIKVEFFHVNSHVSSKNMKQVKKKFEKFNNCKVSDEEFAFIILQNSLCDKGVKEAYEEYKLKNKSQKTN
jgi:ribonuclease HI